jgi:hypothetical protein
LTGDQPGWAAQVSGPTTSGSTAAISATASSGATSSTL